MWENQNENRTRIFKSSNLGSVALLIELQERYELFFANFITLQSTSTLLNQ